MGTWGDRARDIHLAMKKGNPEIAWRPDHLQREQKLIISIFNNIGKLERARCKVEEAAASGWFSPKTPVLQTNRPKPLVVQACKPRPIFAQDRKYSDEIRTD